MQAKGQRDATREDGKKSWFSDRNSALFCRAILGLNYRRQAVWAGGLLRRWEQKGAPRLTNCGLRGDCAIITGLHSSSSSLGITPDTDNGRVYLR